MRWLGVDPGLSGALALLEDGHLTVYDMPTRAVRRSNSATGNEVDGYELGRLLRELKPDYAIVERVGGRPTDSSHSAFTFGKSAGVVEGQLAFMQITYELVMPRTWQREYNIMGVSYAHRGKKPEDKSTKELSRSMATTLWPKQADLFKRVKDNGRSDAALIAEYARRHAKIDRLSNLL